MLARASNASNGSPPEKASVGCTAPSLVSRSHLDELLVRLALDYDEFAEQLVK